MTVLCLFAHPDDEAFGPAGTIYRLSQKHTIVIASMCNGARPHAPASVAAARAGAFVASCRFIGADPVIYDTDDTCLTFDEALLHIERLVERHKPTIVITHSMADLHRDHRTVAEAALVACRMKPGSSVKELYAAEMQPSTDWSLGQIQPQFQPNVYYDVTSEMSLKQHVLGLYGTETYEAPDARSIDAMVTRAKYRGFQAGVEYAEALHQIYAVK